MSSHRGRKLAIWTRRGIMLVVAASVPASLTAACTSSTKGDLETPSGNGGAPSLAAESSAGAAGASDEIGDAERGNAPGKPVDVGTPDGDYAPSPGVETDFAADVDPLHAHDDYPRPRLTRHAWATLNGLWDYAVTSEGDQQPTFDGARLLVPFPLESQLSGVLHGRLGPDGFLWYRRHFNVPSSWRSRRILLHFEAVDWDASVRVNGQEVARHQGGYDGFSADITPQLTAKDEQELVVRVSDPTDTGEQPHGRQALSPVAGSSLTAVSGIWQSVWLEPAPELSIEDVAIEGDPATGVVQITPTFSADASGTTLRAVVRADDVELARGESENGNALELTVPAPLAWTPESPHLYGVTLELRRNDERLDSVDSYFGLRTLSLGKDAGVTKVFLNGAPFGGMGVVYQGYWPDGLYTPASDAALEADLELVKKLGFNTVRVHEKLEGERFYYWADRLGLLVWQDIPAGRNATEEARDRFASELEAMVSARRSHPSLALWTLFSDEGGPDGANLPKLVERVKQLTKTQLVSGASGADDDGSGDIRDRPASKFVSCPVPDERAVALGRFGSFQRALKDHSADGFEELAAQDDSARYVDLARRARGLMIHPGLSFAIYQQLTDVESELDGLVSYDRQVLKVLPEVITAGNTDAAPIAPLVQASEFDVEPAYSADARSFRYTETAPPAGWAAADFDDSEWSEGAAGIGETVDVDARVRTPLAFTELWARTQFELDAPPAGRTFVRMMHDEDTQVYVNGVLVADTYDFVRTYGDFLAADAVNAALVMGTNTIAVHTINTNLSRYIDVGLWTTSDAPELLPAADAGTAAPGLAYDDYDQTFDALPAELSGYTPRATGMASSIGVYAPSLVADDTRALRLHGYVDAPTDGVYTFFVDTDDGARLEIDGQRVAEASRADGTHITERAGNVALARGRHVITLQYFANDNQEPNTLSVAWAGPGFAPQGIPASRLSH